MPNLPFASGSPKFNSPAFCSCGHSSPRWVRWIVPSLSQHHGHILLSTDQFNKHMHVTQFWPMRNKEKSDRRAVGKLCSLLNDTGLLFPSAWCVNVYRGMARTAVASCDHNSRKIAKYVVRELVCVTNRIWQNWQYVISRGLWVSHLEPSLHLGSLTGESQLPCPEDSSWRGSKGKELGPEELRRLPWSGSLSPKGWQNRPKAWPPPRERPWAELPS